MEAFNFSLSLGVSGGSVFLGDSLCCEEVFEFVGASLESGGEDDTVVGQG